MLADVKKADPSRRRLVLLEMEAHLLRFALSPALQKKQEHQTQQTHAALGAGGLKRVEEMARFIAHNYTRKLTTEDVSGAVQLHPNYAMNLFKKTFGLSMVDYITQHRISHAQRLLATTDEKIIEVALNSGFNSISRFNEAFKRACSCSPREFRDNHRLT